jgi:multidrug efflux pump
VNFFTRHIAVGSMTSAWWVHLSTAMVFGLMLATILTLILTPVLLAAPTVFRENRAKRRAARAAKNAVAVNDNTARERAMKLAAE